MISLGMAIANLLRKQTLAVLISFFAFSMVSLMSYYWTNLQVPLNPLFFNYKYQILGHRFTVFEVYRNVVHHHPPVSWLYLLVFIIAILIILALSSAERFKLINPRKSKTRHLMMERLPSKLKGIGFEWAKLGNNVSPALLNGSLIVLVGFFIMLIAFQDQSLVNEMYSPEVFESNQGMIDTSQDMIEQIDQMALSEEEAMVYSSAYQDATKRLEYYQDKNEALELRQSSYENQEGDIFYQTFDQEINEHYYVGELMSEHVMAGESKYLHSRYPSAYGYAVSLDRLDELQRRDIRPIYQANIQNTPYDTLKDRTANLTENLWLQDRDQSFLGLTYRLLNYYRLDIILIVVVLLVAGAGYTVEYQNGNHLDWLYTMPQSRRKILNEKLIAGATKALGIISLFLLITLIIGLILGGWGQGETPIIRYLSYSDNASLQIISCEMFTQHMNG